MTTEVIHANSGDMPLTLAILVYGAGRVATVHQPVRSSAGLGLSAGSPLTVEALQEIAAGLDSGHEAVEILPPNVFARTPKLIGWTTEQQERVMYYHQIPEVSGLIYPQPRLVWVATGRALFVRAIAGTGPVTSATPLYLAPYWNVSDNGLVCLGSSSRPTDLSASGIGQWVDGFFGSAFSHPNNKRMSVDTFHYQWAAARTAGKYPAKSLIPTKETLGGWLKAEVSR